MTTKKKKELLPRNSGKWTEGRFNGFITSTLRAGSRRWPPKYETLNESKTEKKTNIKTGRMAQHYRCASCDEEFVASEVQVDHIEPVAAGQDTQSWDSFINRLFCEKENLQVLCITCHKIKSKGERGSKERN